MIKAAMRKLQLVFIANFLNAHIMWLIFNIAIVLCFNCHIVIIKFKIWITKATNVSVLNHLNPCRASLFCIILQSTSCGCNQGSDIADLKWSFERFQMHSSGPEWCQILSDNMCLRKKAWTSHVSVKINQTLIQQRWLVQGDVFGLSI